MLQELYILRSYYEESSSAVYEDDLRAQYGDACVDEAIARGDLEHRRLPCKRNKNRCVCWLSDQALQRIAAHGSAQTTFH
ncbi:MAG: hypothetical protein QF692_02690 [Alphaproteobacteria bacterium]|jgi:hypothetical protein|nr:hypothetical protein [Alphaproteobacteria bacterium]MDP7222152.1 hypothetical protein [Alphaproteobacteria bacterium]